MTVLDRARGACWMTLSVLSLTLALAAVSFGQMPAECVGDGSRVVNPTRVCFEASPDHDAIDRYDLDLIDPLGVVVNTINIGVPPAPVTPDGTRWVSWPGLNVQPTAFGVGYHGVLRAVAAMANSPDSNDSNLWDRAPGRPGGSPRFARQ